MAGVLDKEWLSQRGFSIQSVAIAGISFDDTTNKLLENYANDSILFDHNARNARMTGAIASGLKAAGANEGGAILGFAGMAMGMNAAGAMGVMSGQQGLQQKAPDPMLGWSCQCGNMMSEDAAFCSRCGSKKTLARAKSSADDKQTNFYSQ